jgi:hypothetical protein
VAAARPAPTIGGMKMMDLRSMLLSDCRYTFIKQGNCVCESFQDVIKISPQILFFAIGQDNWCISIHKRS